MSEYSKENLAMKKCAPCEGVGSPLPPEEAHKYLKSLSDWKLSSDHNNISSNYVMKDFMAAIRLMQKIAEIAESEDHHPDFHLTGYRNLKVELSTHSIGGLSVNDFIVASKIDTCPKELK